jgi:hypothetical protein
MTTCDGMGSSGGRPRVRKRLNDSAASQAANTPGSRLVGDPPPRLPTSEPTTAGLEEKTPAGGNEVEHVRLRAFGNAGDECRFGVATPFFDRAPTIALCPGSTWRARTGACTASGFAHERENERENDVANRGYRTVCVHARHHSSTVDSYPDARGIPRRRGSPVSLGVTARAHPCRCVTSESGLTTSTSVPRDERRHPPHVAFGRTPSSTISETP